MKRESETQKTAQQTAYCRSCGIEIVEGEYCGPCDPTNQRRGIFCKVHYTEVWPKSCRCGKHSGPHWMLDDWISWEALLTPLACYKSHLEGFASLLCEEVQHMEDCVQQNRPYDIARLVVIKQRVHDINWAKMTHERLLWQAKYNVADHMACGHITVEKGTDILLLFALLSPTWQQRVSAYRLQRDALYSDCNRFIATINEQATRGNPLLHQLLFAAEQSPKPQSLW